MSAARFTAAAVLACAACGGDDGPPVDAEIGMHTLTGVVRYEDRAQQRNGRLSTTRVPTPARAVQISLLADDDGAVIASGVTGDDGSYQFEYVGGPSEPVHLLAAAVSTNPDRPIVVGRSGGAVHGFGGPSFGLEATTMDLLITEASGEAEAFNIFDQLVTSADVVREQLGLTPTMLRANWARGSNDGTYYDGSLKLLGASSDDDGYDDTVILHEAGHFIEDVVGRTDSPGGQHDGSPTDPNLAWSEGFATYWAMSVTGVPFYGDSNAGGGWGYNGDTAVTRAPQAAGPLDQDVPENMITEVLWDLGDAGATDDDPHAGTQLAVQRIQPDYLRATPLRADGERGVDLVDFLDGYLMAAGQAPCAAVRTIVVTNHSFPYDFGGATALCP